MSLIRQGIAIFAVMFTLLLLSSESINAANFDQTPFSFPELGLKITFNADHQLVYRYKDNGRLRIDQSSEHDELHKTGIRWLNDKLHLAWTSTIIGQDFSQIRYSAWDGSKFSKPVTINTSSNVPHFSPRWLQHSTSLNVSWFTYQSTSDLTLIEKQAVLGNTKWMPYALQVRKVEIGSKSSHHYTTSDRAMVIVNLGDSIAGGWKCVDDASGVRSCTQQDRDKHGQQTGGYVPKAIELLGQYLGKDVHMHNEAIGGDTTYDLRIKLDSIMSKYPNATHAFILSGANDGSSTGLHLRAILQTLLSRNIIPIVSTVTPEARGRASKNVQILAETMALDVAVNATYKYLLPYWNTGNTCNADGGDHLHISYCGDELIANSILTTFKKVYPKPNISGILQLLLG